MREVEIGDYVDVLSGFAFASKKFNEKGNGTPIIRIRDVGKEESETYFDGDFDEKYLIEKDDLLIAMDGEFRLAKWNGRPSLLNQRVCRIKSISEDLLDDYLYYAIPSKLQKIEDSTSYVTVKHLSVKKINAIQIPLPSLSEQKAIVAKLDRAQRLIDIDREMLHRYDDLIQSVFLEMFGDPVRNPKGWEVRKLGNFAKIERNGFDPTKFTGTKRYVGLHAIEKETGKFVENEKVSEGEIKSTKFIFSKEHILYGKLRPYLNKVAFPDFEGICSTDILPIKSINSKSTKFFVGYLLKSKDFVNYADKNSSGANLPRISPKMVEKFSAICPPINLQYEFDKVVQKILRESDLTESNLQKSEFLFSSIVQQAFSKN